MSIRHCFTVMLLFAIAATVSAHGTHAKGKASALVARGRYLVKIASCNDCHTEGYIETGGKVPERRWLTGNRLGWQGPWGTTYPPNLRLFLQTLTEAEWLKLAKTSTFRPPMPWFALHAMSRRDLRAIYRFVRHLGPAGVDAPAFVPAGEDPKGPVVRFPLPPPASAGKAGQ